MRTLICSLFALVLPIQSWAQPLDLVHNLPSIRIIELEEDEQANFVKYAQFQLELPIYIDSESGLPFLKEPEAHLKTIETCIDTAIANGVDVLIFPELSASLPTSLRETLEKSALYKAKEHELFIILGSYYDGAQRSRILVITPEGIYRSFKIKPSRFEVSPIKGEGMQEGDTLYVFQTKFGNILPITCVDLLSDDVQYVVRNLSNNQTIEVLANINWNPATWEFMREASALVNRHPLFVSITNNAVDSLTLERNKEKLQKAGKWEAHTSYCQETGYGEYGNSSLFGSLRANQRAKVTPLLSKCFKNPEKEKLLPSYQNLIFALPPSKSGMLTYELNLRVIRLPDVTQAPDQGYPLVRNYEVVEL